MSLIFKQITDIKEFFSLKEQWNCLVKSTDVDHAFMRHEWFESWVKYLKPDSKLAIQTAWDNDRLVGIAPLQILREKRKGISLRILSFMKSYVTPRCNLIVDNSIDPIPFFDSIFKTRNWDIIELKCIEADKPITKKLINYLHKTRNFVIEEGIQSPYDIFDSDWDAYLKSRSKSTKKNFRRSTKRLKNVKSYKIVKIEKYEDFDKYFDNLIEISNQSWKKDARTDLKSMPEMAGFYKEFCRLTSNDNLFVLFVLLIDDAPAAFDFCLKYNNCLVGLRSDFDKKYTYYMPGIFIHYHTIKEIFGDDQSWEFDCSGVKSNYKLALVGKLRRHLDITIGKSGLYGNFIMFAKKIFLRFNNIADLF